MGHVFVTPKPRLFFFRHGETKWSLLGRHTGVTDLALTLHGERQARALKPWTAQVAFSRVLTSPRLRARTTCALAGLGEQAEVEPDLAEWDYGDYEGRRSVDIEMDRPGWNLFRDGCPHGETPQQISARVDHLIDRLLALGGDIALFGHGQMGAVLVARWIGLPPMAGAHFSLSPASMGILSWDAHHTDGPAIALWNATPYLGAM